MAESIDYLLLFWLANLYLWYQTFMQAGKKPVDVVTLIFVFSGGFITGAILADRVEAADMSLWTKMAMFVPYLLVVIFSCIKYRKNSIDRVQ